MGKGTEFTEGAQQNQLPASVWFSISSNSLCTFAYAFKMPETQDSNNTNLSSAISRMSVAFSRIAAATESAQGPCPSLPRGKQQTRSCLSSSHSSQSLGSTVLDSPHP